MIERLNPLDVPEKYALIAMYPSSGLYVWVDYENGEMMYTEWPEIPHGLHENRPVARVYTGNYEIPGGLPCSKLLNYGPAAGGLGEAGAFKIQTCGERIDFLAPYIGFKNRNLGALLVGKKVNEALIYLERFVGQFSVSYASLFVMLTSDVDEKCRKYIRFALELERLHNHIWVMHKLAGDASQKVASAHLAAMTEELLRLNHRVLGHRYGMGFLRLGPRTYGEFHRKIKELGDEFTGLSEELLDSRIFVDRLHTTCRLTQEDIVKNDTGGIPARASGIGRDARKFGVGAELFPKIRVRTQEDGDALARMMVRVEEALDAFSYLENAEPGGCDLKWRDGFHHGMIEAPPGDAFMAVRVEAARVKEFIFRPASLPLYHAFSIGIRGNVFTDFPFALDSFGIYFADADSFGRWA